MKALRPWLYVVDDHQQRRKRLEKLLGKSKYAIKPMGLSLPSELIENFKANQRSEGHTIVILVCAGNEFDLTALERITGRGRNLTLISVHFEKKDGPPTPWIRVEMREGTEFPGPPKSVGVWLDSEADLVRLIDESHARFRIRFQLELLKQCQEVLAKTKDVWGQGVEKQGLGRRFYGDFIASLHQQLQADTCALFLKAKNSSQGLDLVWVDGIFKNIDEHRRELKKKRFPLTQGLSGPCVAEGKAQTLCDLQKKKPPKFLAPETVRDLNLNTGYAFPLKAPRGTTSECIGCLVILEQSKEVIPQSDLEYLTELTASYLGPMISIFHSSQKSRVEEDRWEMFADTMERLFRRFLSQRKMNSKYFPSSFAKVLQCESATWWTRSGSRRDAFQLAGTYNIKEYENKIGESYRTISIQPGKGMIGWAAANKKAIILNTRHEIERHQAFSRRSALKDTHSTLVYPVIDRYKRVIGVFRGYNKLPDGIDPGLFSDDADMKFAEHFCALTLLFQQVQEEYEFFRIALDNFPNPIIAVSKRRKGEVLIFNAAARKVLEYSSAYSRKKIIGGSVVQLYKDHSEAKRVEEYVLKHSRGRKIKAIPPILVTARKCPKGNDIDRLLEIQLEPLLIRGPDYPASLELGTMGTYLTEEHRRQLVEESTREIKQNILRTTAHNLGRPLSNMLSSYYGIKENVASILKVMTSRPDIIQMMLQNRPLIIEWAKFLSFAVMREDPTEKATMDEMEKYRDKISHTINMADRSGDAVNQFAVLMEKAYDILVRFQRMSKELDRINYIIELLREVQAWSPEATDINECVKEVVAEHHPARSRIKLESDLTEKSAMALAKKILIQEFLRELIINAEEAIIDGNVKSGKIIVSTCRAQGWIHLQVSNNGPPISPEAQEKITMETYTTKSQGNHQGRALFIMTRTLHLMNGELSFSSSKQEETTFTIRLRAIGPQGGSNAKK